MRRLGNAIAFAFVVILGLTSFAAAGASTPTPHPMADCAAVGVGSHGPAVASIQRLVGAAADGDFGPLTAKAVRGWQAKHKVKVTGVVDVATWRKMPISVAGATCGQQVRGAGVVATCTTLQVGATGPAVVAVQRALRITADGAFGPMTRTAVLAAQRRLRLATTGVVDAATWAALARTGTPACVSAPSVHLTSATPSPAPSASTSPAPKPPADAAQQAKVRAQVVALAAKLPGQPGTSTDKVALQALAFAKSQTGKPYKWGGVGPASYDCSGLVLAAYQAAGITTPRVAADQYGTGVAVPLDQVRQGDLLFYAMDVTQPATIYHVVMYVGAGQVIDAPYTGAFVGTRALWTRDLLPVAWRPSGLLVLPAKAGATGWTVAQLQQALDRGGAKLAVDGAYGPATTTAVRAWQKSHELAVTGVTDLTTWLSLH